jgi:Co/Zn/Cd efflux system component
MDTNPRHLDPRYRAALLFGAVINGLAAVAEGTVGFWIGSAALIADAADFIEDAGAYSLAIVAIGWAVRRRARVTLVMAAAMALVGAVALWQAWQHVQQGIAPSALPMAATAIVAFAVNVASAVRLGKWRHGDAGMRTIWLSTRNDAMLNLVVLAAALATAASFSAWPDIAAGVAIAAVNLWAAVTIGWQAWRGAARLAVRGGR